MKIHIVNSSGQYVQMYESLGFTIVDEEDADILAFTGGSDVDPSLYGEEPHHHTQFNCARDMCEQEIYLRNPDKLKVGICRGAQFLHVMNFGSLWQDVTNHARHGTHKLTCTFSGKTWGVTSTHHQMMRQGPTGILRGVARESGYVECVDEGGVRQFHLEEDVEVIEHEKSLCFQPHPEFYGADSTKDCFVHFLTKFLNNHGVNTSFLKYE